MWVDYSFIGALFLLASGTVVTQCDPDLHGFIPLVVLELAVWCLAVVMLASTRGRTWLRVSNPGLLMAAWFAAFFIFPAMDFMLGHRISLREVHVTAADFG